MSTPIAPSFVVLREEIMLQHGRLRGLLGSLKSEAERVVRSDGRLPFDLPSTLSEIVHALEAHMAFEEHGLALEPAAAKAWGPDNLAHLHAEHERQHEELACLTREARSSDDRISLARTIQGYVSDVLLDMSLEEGRLAV